MRVINCQYKYNDNRQKHILFLTEFNNEVFTLFLFVIYVCLVVCLYISCTLSLVYSFDVRTIYILSFISNNKVQNTY